MRIISGKMRGLQLKAPDNLPVRPTTDQAKESLFNILSNQFDLEETDCLDLFAGTGNISFELCSRDAKSVISVDRNTKCCRYIDSIAKKHQLEQLHIVQSDVYKFLESCRGSFDFIFADPPYDMPNLFKIPELVFGRNLLNPGGWVVVEHSSLVQLNQSLQYKEFRKYGSSAFSFFYI